MRANDRSISVLEIVIYPLLASLTAGLQIAMEWIPNVHFTGLLVMLMTLLFRKRAILPILIYVFLMGLRHSFSVMWLPNLYLWPMLYLVTLFLPRDVTRRSARILYPVVCGLFGLLYGTLYSPVWALTFHLDWQGIGLWILQGIPYDLIHGAGNFCAALLLCPLHRRLFPLWRRLVQTTPQ